MLSLIFLNLSSISLFWLFKSIFSSSFGIIDIFSGLTSFLSFWLFSPLLLLFNVSSLPLFPFLLASFPSLFVLLLSSSLFWLFKSIFPSFFGFIDIFSELTSFLSFWLFSPLLLLFNVSLLLLFPFLLVSFPSSFVLLLSSSLLSLSPFSLFSLPSIILLLGLLVSIKLLATLPLLILFSLLLLFVLSLLISSFSLLVIKTFILLLPLLLCIVLLFLIILLLLSFSSFLNLYIWTGLTSLSGLGLSFPEFWLTLSLLLLISSFSSKIDFFFSSNSSRNLLCSLTIAYTKKAVNISKKRRVKMNPKLVIIFLLTTELHFIAFKFGLVNLFLNFSSTGL